MTKFRCFYPNSCFIFDGARYELDGDIFETDNAGLIEFLKSNVNFELVSTPKAK